MKTASNGWISDSLYVMYKQRQREKIKSLVHVSSVFFPSPRIRFTDETLRVKQWESLGFPVIIHQRVFLEQR